MHKEFPNNVDSFFPFPAIFLFFQLDQPLIRFSTFVVSIPRIFTRFIVS